MSELCFTEKLFAMPRTRTGWWAVGLEAAFFLLAATMVGWGGTARWGFDPAANALAAATGVTGISAGVAGAVAIFRHGERSLALVVTLLTSALVLTISTAQLA